MSSVGPRPRARKKTGDYKRKIVTRDELSQIIGAPPRSEVVVMCHGTFDVVHPGHLRHLMYAKDRGDILIASLTSDVHITKANYRPYVPEELRALNLAALEMIDYVVIDRNATPIENILFLKPDYFAKGFEYSQNGVHPSTREEITALASYGGEVIFTPGDVVYSSSALIDACPPRIQNEKLAVLMESEGVTFKDLRDAFQLFPSVKVHVIGDTIVDSYTQCAPGGASTKTPTLTVKYVERIDYAGGAAVVAKHLRKAGAQVSFSTVLGDDELKDFIIRDLQENDVSCSPVIDKTRPTTNKHFFVANGYHLLKVDRLDSRTVGDRILASLRGSLRTSEADVFIFSDYRHGIFSRATIPMFVSCLHPEAFKVADSQVASRWGNILEFQEFDIITPNEREARFALGDQDSVVRPLAMELYNRAKCKLLILKLGERGVLTYRDAKSQLRSFFIVDAFADRVVDAVGSGDALLAYATLAKKTTGSEVIASILGSLAAAAACEKEGNSPVTPDEVLAKIDAVEQSQRFK